MEIFPNLPEEIGRECLLRVCYQFHSKLRAVCKNWDAVVGTQEFYNDRKRIGTSEQSICLIQAVPSRGCDKTQNLPIFALTLYDPLKGLWKRQFPPLPELANGIPLFSECVCVKQKLVLIGGWNPSTWEAMGSIFVFDFSSGKWSRGTDMPKVRSLFACSVSNEGFIYVAGGHDDGKNALRGAAVYDIEENRWETLGEMKEERDECRGAFIDGKFFVISGYETRSQGRFKGSAEVFDPNTGMWATVENMWIFGGCPRSCIAAGFGFLFSFQRDGVMRYDCRRNVWIRLECLPEGIEYVQCATAWKEEIFVKGSGHGSSDQMCYMFRPPNPSLRKGVACWVAIGGNESFAGAVQSASTLEI